MESTVGLASAKSDGRRAKPIGTKTKTMGINWIPKNKTNNFNGLELKTTGKFAGADQ
jgi:hypothetical protein